MSTDNALAQLWVTPKYDGDIGLRTGRAQKFPKVEFTHPYERWVNRSLSIVDNYEGITFSLEEFWKRVSRSQGSKPLYLDIFLLCFNAEVAQPG